MLARLHRGQDVLVVQVGWAQDLDGVDVQAQELGGVAGYYFHPPPLGGGVGLDGVDVADGHDVAGGVRQIAGDV